MGVRELRGELRAKVRAELRGAQEVERQERAGDREELGGGQDRDEAGERAERVEDREAAHHQRHLRRRVLLLREGAGEVLRAEEGGGEDAREVGEHVEGIEADHDLGVERERQPEQEKTGARQARERDVRLEHFPRERQRAVISARQIERSHF